MNLSSTQIPVYRDPKNGESYPYVSTGALVLDFQRAFANSLKIHGIHGARSIKDTTSGIVDALMKSTALKNLAENPSEQTFNESVQLSRSVVENILVNDIELKSLLLVDRDQSQDILSQIHNTGVREFFLNCAHKHSLCARKAHQGSVEWMKTSSVSWGLIRSTAGANAERNTIALSVLNLAVDASLELGYNVMYGGIVRTKPTFPLFLVDDFEARRTQYFSEHFRDPPPAGCYFSLSLDNNTP